MKKKVKLLTDIALGLVNLIYEYSDQLPEEFLKKVCKLSKEFRANITIELLGNIESEN